MSCVTYDWAYLCNNPRRLRITLRLLPPTMQGLRVMHVCYASHLDGTDAPERLGPVLDRYAPTGIAWTITDLSPLRDRLPEQLAAYWSNGKKRWSLGMKLVLPFRFKDAPYLYTDDDVLIPNDPQPLMTQSFGSKGCFRFAGRKTEVAKQLFDAFGMINQEPPHVEYDRAALDAGVWFDRHPIWPCDGLGDWEWYLSSFAHMPYLQQLTTRNLELRCLDQRFLTMFGIKNNWRVQSIGNGFAPPREIRPSLLTNKYFFHYKSQSKERWMQLLETYIDGHC